ncbi:MAG: LytTR family DNA-binding domain-containing protein [Bacteroidales bacterium]
MDKVTIRCVAVDDEPLALEKLKGFIAKVRFLELAGAFQSAIEAMQFIKTNPVDMMFLDIQMDDLTGIQFLEIMKERPQVVLTTAYSEYALKGYELDVADYLLKPISFERFMQAVNRVADKLKLTGNSPEDQTLLQQSPYWAVKDFILVKADYHMEKVVFREILYIEGMKDYLGIVTTQKRIMTLMNFSTIEELLPPVGFCRIHKSYIIALDKIDKIDRNHIIIQKERIPIGETYRKAFFEHLKSKGIIPN